MSGLSGLDELDELDELDALDELEELEATEIDAHRKAERIFLRRTNPLVEVATHHFKQMFRFDKNGLRFLINELNPHLVRPSSKNAALNVEQEICLVLRILSKNSMQFDSGYSTGCSQSTASRSLHRVVDALVSIADRWITWPTGVEKTRIQNHFFEKFSLPGVIGAIDGTMVRIQRPSTSEADYICRKGFPALNVGLVIDHKRKIRWCSSQFPGSAHDSRVFTVSHLYADLKSGAAEGTLLGDSGYKLETFTLTPFRTPRTNQEIEYNKAQTAARSIVEMGIGCLKKQWSILRSEIRYTPQFAARIVVACCVLRNMKIELGNSRVGGGGNDSDDDDDDLLADAPSPISSDTESDDDEDGIEHRNQIIERYF